MNIVARVETQSGYRGQWNPQGTVYRCNPLEYGYLVPVQEIEIEGGGLCLSSSPLTNAEWWHQFMPVSSCPRFKGQLIEIKDRFDPFCQQGGCAEACGAEDAFVDLSAGRLRILEDAEAIERYFPRLHFYNTRAEALVQACREAEKVKIMLDVDGSILRLRARILPEHLPRHVQAFKSLYPQITGVHGKVSTQFLPAPPDFSDVDIAEDNVLEESRFYGLQEAVRMEALDILAFLVEKKNGTIADNVYHLSDNNVSYTLRHNAIEAMRDGLYMGQEGFKKGVAELQRFFQTTLGGGRW